MEALADDLDKATAVQMHHMFEGSAHFLTDSEARRQEMTKLVIGRHLQVGEREREKEREREREREV